MAKNENEIKSKEFLKWFERCSDSTHTCDSHLAHKVQETQGETLLYYESNAWARASDYTEINNVQTSETADGSSPHSQESDPDTGALLNNRKLAAAKIDRFNLRSSSASQPVIHAYFKKWLLEHPGNLYPS